MKRKEEMDSNMEDTNEENLSEEKSLQDSSVEEISILAKIEAELTDQKDKYLRLYSEFENYKRRVTRDRIEQSKMAGADIFLSIIPIIDDFERAMKSFKDAKDVNSIREGIELIYSKMKTIIESRGLKPMDAIGTTFDPELHDAITNIPAPSDDMKGKVVEEIEKGYYLNDKVIRHAKVIVGN